MHVRVVLLLLAILTFGSLTSQSPVPPQSPQFLEPDPDPSLVPVIDQLIENVSGAHNNAEVCGLFAKLETMTKSSESDSNSRQQTLSTLKYINTKLTDHGVDACRFSSSLSMPDTEELLDPQDPPREKADLAQIDEEDEDFLYSEAVQGLDLHELCDNCEVDYDDAESKEFFKAFEHDPREEAEQSMKNARNKLTKLFVFGVLGVVGLIVVITMTLFFSIRACVRASRRRRVPDAQKQKKLTEG